jgi:hypothetical protein
MFRKPFTDALKQILVRPSLASWDQVGGSSFRQVEGLCRRHVVLMTVDLFATHIDSRRWVVHNFNVSP